MATTGRLYASTASGWTNAAAATGAPDGATVTAPEVTRLVAGGFGVQAAIGSQPSTITAVRVGVRASAASATFISAEILSPWWFSNLLLSTALADQSETVSPTPTWAQLGSLEVRLSRVAGYPAQYVDAVWVEVDYPTLHPMSGTVTVTTAVTGSLAADRPLSGTITPTVAVSGSLGVKLGGQSGTVEVTTAVTGSLSLLADMAGQVDVSTAVAGQAGALLGLSGTVPVTVAVSGEISRVEIRIIRPPARTIGELVGSSTIRRDHVIILDGPRAGESLPIIGGELLLDETADIHATGSLELPPELWLRDYLDPLRTRVELQVVLALEGDDGTVHEWPRAIVHATEMPLQVSADGGLSLSVQVADRADWVSKRGMDEPYAGSGSLSLMSHVVALVARYAPWLPVSDLTDPGYRSGTDLLIGAVGEDPWEHAVQLAWTAGQRLYIDADGRLSSRPVLAADVEVARWVEGEDECLIADMSTAMSDADVCNRLGVPWEELEPEDPPEGWTPRGGWEWWEDATGPLGTAGPLGIRARAYSGDASVIHSPPHARDVAMSHGLAQQGVQLPLDFVVLADPRRQVGDVIRVTRAALGISDELARIQSLRYQLGSALMSGSMGARRIL